MSMKRNHPKAPYEPIIPSTISEKKKYPPGFSWNNRKGRTPRDLTKCPSCEKKIIILREDNKWIYETCSKCSYKRKRRK